MADPHPLHGLLPAVAGWFKRSATCGQLCGQATAMRPEKIAALAGDAVAEKWGSIFLMQNKHLHERDSSVTAMNRLQALRAAAVEFCSRASRGFQRV